MTTKPDIKTWKDLNIGGVVESGTSEHFHTGDWRVKVPVWQKDNCIQCMQCVTFCPDDAIGVTEGKNAKTGKPELQRTGYNYDFCKGCGICAEECPVKKKAVKAAKEKDPDAKVNGWSGAGNEAYAEKAAILMVSLKEAKEKYNIK